MEVVSGRGINFQVFETLKKWLFKVTWWHETWVGKMIDIWQPLVNKHREYLISNYYFNCLCCVRVIGPLPPGPSACGRSMASTATPPPPSLHISSTANAILLTFLEYIDFLFSRKRRKFQLLLLKDGDQALVKSWHMEHGESESQRLAAACW